MHGPTNWCCTKDAVIAPGRICSGTAAERAGVASSRLPRERALEHGKAEATGIAASANFSEAAALSNSAAALAA